MRGIHNIRAVKTKKTIVNNYEDITDMPKHVAVIDYKDIPAIRALFWFL
jgi:hypothetical protein